MAWRQKKASWEVCAHRRCSNEFRPKREQQRFCSDACRKAVHYDLNRTSRTPRKKRLKPPSGAATAAPSPSWAQVPRSVQSGKKTPSSSVANNRVVDLVGVDRTLLAKIIEVEVPR